MLPAAASLQKQGANKGAVTAFLISTPESGVDSIALTYALLDPIMTIVRPVAAFISALFAGILENIVSYRLPLRSPEVDKSLSLDSCSTGEECQPSAQKRHPSLLQKLQAGVRFAVVDIWGDIVVWFSAGIVIAGVITALVPEEVMVRWLGGGLGSMLLMLVFGIPLYICASASTPIAAALILKGVSPGAALVFLLVGPATNITTITVLVKLLGRWSVVRYLVVLASVAVLFGLGVDYLYLFFDIIPKAVIGEAGEFLPYGIKLGSCLLLILLSIKPVTEIVRKNMYKKKAVSSFYSGFPEIDGVSQKKGYEKKPW